MKRGSAVFARDREIQEGKDLCFVFVKRISIGEFTKESCELKARALF